MPQPYWSFLFWTVVGAVVLAGVVVFGLWLDAGWLADDASDDADDYGTAVAILWWLLVLLLAGRFARWLAIRVRRRRD